MKNKLVDLFYRKVLRRHHWVVVNPIYDRGCRKRNLRLRVDALPVEQFKVQREQAAARIRSMHE